MTRSNFSTGPLRLTQGLAAVVLAGGALYASDFYGWPTIILLLKVGFWVALVLFLVRTRTERFRQTCVLLVLALAVMVVGMKALERYQLHRETKALQQLGQKIQQQKLSEAEFAAAEERSARLNLEAKDADLRLIRVRTQFVIGMERLRRDLVPVWTRADMLKMVEPAYMVSIASIDEHLERLRIGEPAFQEYAQKLDALFERYRRQIRTIAPGDYELEALEEKMSTQQAQHRQVNDLILTEMRLIRQVLTLARPLAAKGQLRVNAQDQLMSADPGFVSAYQTARERLEELENQSTTLFEDMELIPRAAEGDSTST